MGCAKSKEVAVEGRCLTSRADTISVDQLRTGDLVLFGATVARDAIIGSRTQTRWTHVGVVMHVPEFYTARGPMLLECADAFADELPDLAWKYTVRTSGVRLVDLHSRIQLSNAQVITCRQLYMGTSAACQLGDAHALEFINLAAGREHGTMGADLNTFKRTRLAPISASELAALALLHLGISHSPPTRGVSSLAQCFDTTRDCAYEVPVELQRQAS